MTKLLDLVFPGLFILSLYFTVQLIVTAICWWVHRSMTIENSRTWDYVSFDRFKKEFEKMKWEYVGRYGYWSMFNTDRDSETTVMRGGQVIFGGRGMVIRFWDFPKFNRYCKRRQTLGRKESGLWKRKLEVVGDNSKRP